MERVHRRSISGPAVEASQRRLKRLLASTVAILFFSILFVPGALWAQESSGESSAGEPQIKEKCLECHGRENTGAPFVDPELFKGSVHRYLLCSNCHLGDPHKSEGQRSDLGDPRKACRFCHGEEFEMYWQSYHGKITATEEEPKAPICIDCHGNHGVQDPRSEEYREGIPGICRQCHGTRYETYLDTYHGKATVLGSAKVAKCTDCHGNHKILPKSNPESTISKANIVDTCGQCHSHASSRFATFLVHVNPSSPDAPLPIFAITVFYIVLITVVFTLAGIHSLLYLSRGIRGRLYGRKRRERSREMEK